MLVLSRMKSESIVIGGLVTVTVIEIRRDKVVLGIDAPKDVEVNREEVQTRIEIERGGRSAARPFS